MGLSENSYWHLNCSLLSARRHNTDLCRALPTPRTQTEAPLVTSIDPRHDVHTSPLTDTATTLPKPKGADEPLPAPTPEKVLREYGPKIFRQALNLLGNEADAEDVTQEVLLQVIRKLDTFRGDAALSTWLYRVTANAALAFRRSRAARKTQPLGAGAADLFEEQHRASAVSRPPSAPDRMAERREMSALVREAIAGLPGDYRQVLEMADLDDMSNAAIGARLGLSLPAVKSRLHRGRAMLRDALAPHFRTPQA
jgi:RNA polymerase sigma-70 factor (ECF subfamily)